jgi:DNA-binding beta-propeller fold protein YncE
VSLINDRTCNATTHAGCANVPEFAVPNGNPTAIAVNTATGTLYVAAAPPTGPSVIDVYDAATCNAPNPTGCSQRPAMVTAGPAGRQIPGMAVNRLTNTVYATNVGSLSEGLAGDPLYVINGNRCDAATTTGCADPPAATTVGLPAFKAIGVPASPEGVAVNEATNTLYVADFENGEGYGAVSVVNGSTCNATTITGCTNQTAPTVAAGFGTFGVAIDSKANQIYATGIQDTSVSVINGATCNATPRPAAPRPQPKPPLATSPLP